MTRAGKCHKCGCDMMLPDELYAAAHRDENIMVYCGYGHPGVFRAGETEADKLRRERDRLTQRLAEKDDEIKQQREEREAAERRASAAKGVATRLRNRTAVGLCPCCNRTVSQLARHMKSKHPEFATTEIIPLEQRA